MPKSGLVLTKAERTFWALRKKEIALNRKVVDAMAEAFPINSVVHFRRGKMVDFAIGRVIMVDDFNGERLKVLNEWTGGEYWIDVSCVVGEGGE